MSMGTMSTATLKQAVLKQEAFVARHQDEWAEFEAWLVARGDSPREARKSQAQWQGLRDEEMPARYRRLCQQLALARSRGYSPLVVERLQSLTQRGHAVFYRAPPPQWRRALGFFLADFPRLVRAQRGCLLAAALLFLVPLVGAFVAVQISPELVYTVYDPVQLAQYESMYDPAAPERKLGRDSGSDLMMFGYYIMNNISIGLRTFASGLLAGVGSMVVLFTNGLMIGGIAGHLQVVGHGDPFWRFVAGHSAPELTAIVLSGAAGMQLGLALIAPGRRRRVDALIEAGKVGAKLCLGVFAMLLFAAFVEAFWSSIGWMPAAVKYAVGGLLWTLTLGWLALGGRGGSAHAAPPRDPPSARPSMAGPDDPQPALSRQGKHHDVLATSSTTSAASSRADA
jgi:uncharacterized membrane protein SpoIIM required for sporulation